MEARCEMLIEALKQSIPKKQIIPFAPMREYTTLKLGGPADVLVSVSSVEEITAFVREMVTVGGLLPELFTPLLKTAAIALISRIGSDLCRDAGESAMASLVETAGAFGAILVSLPLMEAVWEMLQVLT